MHAGVQGSGWEPGILVWQVVSPAVLIGLISKCIQAWKPRFLEVQLHYLANTAVL